MITMSKTNLDVFVVGCFQRLSVRPQPLGQGRVKKLNALSLSDLSINLRFECCVTKEKEIVNKHPHTCKHLQAIVDANTFINWK